MGGGTMNFPVFSCQILPKDNNSIARATSAAAAIVRNAAIASGFQPEIITRVVPDNSGVFIIHVGIATTDVQKEQVRALKLAENKNAVLTAGAASIPPVDEDLERDLETLEKGEDDTDDSSPDRH
ncbi:MAG: hypothetical protein NC305_07720 [Lachnospiraceae bacterium]|nr:hypothetical protein [Butyrivibrio sp.]MCM1343097.1 hypothetical protein [Muribaculaceae bacterium]MCM1410418.1 hypothetical protein [Lachnospiraceae bacterium]